MKKFGKFLVTVTAIAGAVAGALVVLKKFKKEDAYEDDFVDVPEEDTAECDCTEECDCSDTCDCSEETASAEACADCEVVADAEEPVVEEAVTEESSAPETVEDAINNAVVEDIAE